MTYPNAQTHPQPTSKTRSKIANKHRVMKNEWVKAANPRPTFPRLGIITPANVIPRNRSHSQQLCLSPRRKSTRNASYADSCQIDWTSEKLGNEHWAETKGPSPLEANSTPSLELSSQEPGSWPKDRDCSSPRWARSWSLGQSWNQAQISRNCCYGDGGRWWRNWLWQHMLPIPSFWARRPSRGSNCGQGMQSPDISEIMSKKACWQLHIFGNLRCVSALHRLWDEWKGCRGPKDRRLHCWFECSHRGTNTPLRGRWRSWEANNAEYRIFSRSKGKAYWCSFARCKSWVAHFSASPSSNVPECRWKLPKLCRFPCLCFILAL